MSYLETIAYNTIKDIEERVKAGRISDKGDFEALCNYLEKYSVDVFYKELKNNELPTEVKIQCEKICQIVDEINE